MSLVDDVTEYYKARASFYDETAGYTDSKAELLRAPIKERYQETFRGRRVLEIACGTGYWTAVVGEAAESLLAIDINPCLISLARQRCKHLPNARFEIADAYTLEGIPSGFTAAFGIWWWSHVPKRQLPGFLAALHSKIEPGSTVLFVDQLPYDQQVRRKDSDGNTLELRRLPDGRTFEIVKNFPTEKEVRTALAGIGSNVRYIERPEEKSWNVIYNKRE
jgi:demethylmenaquinone methyltransferase/2-methoxy-6-polyprenyl-1,4-benzoquinol methylase